MKLTNLIVPFGLLDAQVSMKVQHAVNAPPYHLVQRQLQQNHLHKRRLGGIMSIVILENVLGMQCSNI